MTRRSLSLALPTSLGLIATQGSAMSKKDPPDKPVKQPKKPSKVGGDGAPVKRPF